MRLLLVEDDVMVASGIKLGLTDAGYAVDWVGSAERAIEATRTEAFDVAVIDIGLPLMDGLALTQQLRKSGFAMPVLILTARGTVGDRVVGLNLKGTFRVMRTFGRAMAEQGRGQPGRALLLLISQRDEALEDFDVAIAAHAVANGAALVTANLKHLRRVEGLRCESWSG